MKREEKIFQKLKNEKPLIKTAESVPLRRIHAAPREPRQAENPARRRIAPVQTELAKQPEYTAHRRITPVEPEPDHHEPQRRRIAVAEPAAKPEAPVKNSVPEQPQPRRVRLNVPPIQCEQQLTDKIGGNPINFALPSKVKKDTAERKELPFRHEEKYYISYGDYLVLRQQLRALLHHDPHADENGEYYIRSLYLDDIYNTAVAEKNAGVQFRHKYRIRIYNFSKNVIRFEKKIKNGKFISKDSFGMSYDEYLAFIRGDIEFLLHKEAPLAKEVYLSMRQNRLRPVVVVDYEREPFVMDYETIRITFDKNLRTGEASWDIFDESLPRTPLLEKGIVVLEVKYNRALPDYLANVINSISGLQESAISKYILCRQYD